MNIDDQIKQMMQQEDQKDTQKEQMETLMPIFTEIQRLGMGFAHLNRTNMIIGQTTDITRLTMQMLFDILVEKNIISKEELEKKHKEEVIDRYKEMEEEMKKALEEEIQKQKEGMEESIKETESNSDVILKEAEESVSNIADFKKQ